MRAKDAWLQGRLAEVLPVPYCHLVFTLPHSLNGLYGAHPRWVIDTLFACTAQTLAEFAANPRWMGAAGGTPAFSLVLHTWTQDLRRHIHLHAVMACGVLGQDGDGCGRWHTPVRKPDFLFPVEALSPVLRGKFLAALAAAHQAGQLERDPQGGDGPWRNRQRQLYQHDWVVYAKTPLAGPAAVLDETSLSLSVHVMDQTRADLAAVGKTMTPDAGEQLVERMVKELKRPGRAGGGGFYDYPKGEAKRLWPELKPLFERDGVTAAVDELKQRLLYRQAIETARCLAEGVLTSVADANIGSIFGIGFPAWTGGAMQFIESEGRANFFANADALARKHGERFDVSAEVRACIEALPG